MFLSGRRGSNLQEDMKRIRRGEKSGYAFFVIGVILVGFGYSVYDGGLYYSGLLLIIMGIMSIAFGFVLVYYSRRISIMV